MEIFKWKPIKGAQGTETARVLTAQFGDGYSQNAADGINNAVQSWPLSFLGRTKVEAEAIVSFFRRHKGYRSFLWTPPLGLPGFYKVASFQTAPMGSGFYTITATFEQVFKP